jgi:hypothetical protein
MGGRGRGGGECLPAHIGFLAATCQAGRARCARPTCRSIDRVNELVALVHELATFTFLIALGAMTAQRTASTARSV